MYLTVVRFYDGSEKVIDYCSKEVGLQCYRRWLQLAVDSPTRIRTVEFFEAKSFGFMSNGMDKNISDLEAEINKAKESNAEN